MPNKYKAPPIRDEEVRAAGKIIHDYGVAHGWFGSHYKKTYEELEKTDSIGFAEFNDFILRALEAAIRVRSTPRTLAKGLKPGSRIDKKA